MPLFHATINLTVQADSEEEVQILAQQVEGLIRSSFSLAVKEVEIDDIEDAY